MIRRERFTFCAMRGAIQSVAATMRLTGRLGHCVQPQSQESCQQWLEAHWRTLNRRISPSCRRHNEPAFTFGRAQPGIWMAEKLSDLPSAWSVRITLS